MAPLSWKPTTLIPEDKFAVVVQVRSLLVIERADVESVANANYPLLVIDEVGYIPFEADAANLFFQLVASRYEQASLIITSNMAFGRWGEIFGDDVVAAAMIDRLVHHCHVLNLKGDSYRTRNRKQAAKARN